MGAKILRNIFFVGLAFFFLSFAFQLGLPTPKGTYAVGRTIFSWADTSRPEALTENPNDVREVIALIWYPAERGTGTRGAYFPGLASVSRALVESGEVESWKVVGLQFVRSQNLFNADPAKSDAPFPILIFSPGNGTNVEFYDSLASEIASHGYIVVGLNYPYDVAAVELSDHRVAQFYKTQEALAMSDHESFIAERIKVRTEDVLFVLNQLEILNSSANSPFAATLDLRSVAAAGHSLGGITASEACKADARFRACLNLDGIQRGGPFSTEETAIPPVQPFLFLTKESKLPPKLIDKFETMPESYWVVIHGASHESFSDGPQLQPSLLPLPNQADRIMSLIQNYTLAFLDQVLKGQPANRLSISMDGQDVSVKVFPSH